MAKRKLNAILSLLTTVMLLAHAIVLGHIAISTSKALITLGIGNAKTVRVVNIVMKVICAVTLGVQLHAGCSKALSCQSVCPMKIDTLTSIMKMNRK